MKQIKGEPWPPGETLTGSKDGIQMGNHEGIILGFWDLFFSNNNLIIIKVCFVFCIIKNRQDFKKAGEGETTKMQKCKCVWPSFPDLRMPCVCGGGVKEAGMPVSPCLAPSQLVCRRLSSLSASSAGVTSWFLFIPFTLGF